MKKQLLKFNKLITSILLVVLVIVSYLTFFDKNIKEVSATWWNDSWNYRKAITINHNQVTGDLENFPMLVSLTDTSLGAHAQSTGNDIIFINAQGEKLSHEIESFATSTGVLVAWLKMPTISSTHDEEIYMYYGNASVSDQQDTENVWDENFKMVQHLEEGGTGTRYDSTSNDNDGTPNNYDGNEAISAGKINGADDFENTNDSISISDNSSLEGMSQFTVETWINLDQLPTTTGNDISIIRKGHTVSPWYSYYLDIRNNGGNNNIFFNTTNVSESGEWLWGNTNFSVDTWYHIVGVYDGINMHVYVNGQDDDASAETQSGSIFDSNDKLNLNNGSYMDGIFDELRISNTARSATWIQTEYNNQNNPSLFLTPQAEETGPGPVGYWSFDEGYGTTAHDESSGGNDGTITGATWTDDSQCISGKCLYFDGDENYVSTINTNILDNNSNVTLAAWIKLATSSKPGLSDIISQQGRDVISINSSNKLEGKCDGGASADVESVASLDDNKWHFVTITGESIGGNGIKLYLDGSLIETASDNSNNAGDGRTRIGAFYNGGNYFHGYIDEVKIYPYARTADQIKQDYNAGLAGVSSQSGVSASFGSQSDKWLSDGLVGYWKMDESATTSGAIDSSGNSNNGTYEGTASTTGGKFGRGGVFDGVGDEINMGDVVEVTGTAELTVSAWFKTPSSGGSDNYFIVSKAGGGDDTFSLRYRADDVIWWQVANKIEEDAIAKHDGTISANTWYHAVGVYDGSQVKVYINGIVGSEIDSLTGLTEYDSAHDLKIGQGMEGTIDEVRIYNRALSAGEVQKLYEWAPGPIMHLKMDKKSGDIAYDTSGNENNGTLTNGPVRSMGKYGSALDFDGVDDYVDSSLTMQGISSFSISWWDRSSIDNQEGARISFDDNAGNRFIIQDYVGHRPLYADGDVWAANPNIFLDDGNWHFYSLTVDDVNGGNWKFYVDGIESLSATHVFSFDSDNLNIGAHNLHGYFFNGGIDDVRIYNYARTQKQILEDMHNGNPMKGAVLDLSFDEGRGNTAHDSSIHKNNGSLQPGDSGTNTSSSSMWSLAGHSGGAMEFDGVDDYVELTNLDLTSTDVVTVAFWFKTDVVISANKMLFEYSTNAVFNNAFYINMNQLGVNGSLSIGDHSGSWNMTYTSKSYADGNWHHFIGIINRGLGTNQTKIYIDGINDTTQHTQNDLSGNFGGPFNSYIISRAGSSEFIDGSIDEVKIYPYALSQDEINKLYNDSKSTIMGSDTSRDNDGTTITGVSKEYCIPGDTAQCDPPVLELKMDKKSGDIAYDTSGNGNDGTINGATHSRGKLGAGLEFDGVDDYVEIEDADILTLTNGATISTWLKIDTLSGDGPWPLIKKRRIGSNSYQLNIYGNKTIEWMIDNGTTAEQSFSTTVVEENNGWYYIEATWDGSDMKLFINGNEEDSDAQTGSMNNTSDSLVVAYGSDVAASFEPFAGIMDDVKVYNYARTPAQVAYDYNRGKPIAHWKFDECSGSTIHDNSGNGNHGTLHLGTAGTTATGTCASSSDSFWYNGKDGKRNSSGSFDGGSDYVEIPSIDLSGTDVVSLSFWFNHDYENSNSTTFEFTESTNTHTTGFGFFPDSTSGNVAMLLKGNVGYNDAGFARPSSGEWHHYILIYDKGNSAADELAMYIDGEISPVLAKSNTNDNTNNFGDEPFYMMSRGGTTEYEDGQIDEVKIYNYALTAEQVKSDYNGGAVRFGQ